MFWRSSSCLQFGEPAALNQSLRRNKEVSQSPFLKGKVQPSFPHIISLSSYGRHQISPKEYTQQRRIHENFSD